ncbi:hypothetical protein CLV62_102114 [Dysgonomonas alginatilytica]|uniref:Uncharacterized protein n=1 Tax=Dysgonomonas alginatilytica TaxID=1605892 RepID=A0A2V3PSM6_9BACT|nr:hypothetical protein [Dysgonomonas alginatilytica]PXV68083.1 hypothetical protein CLV62_102114 [Dysgonomonas alginatilytica]
MKNLFLLILCIFTFSSCSNDGEIFTSTSVSNESVDSKPVLKTMEFSYKGKFYSSEYYEEGDSVIILDYETQITYNKLGKNENKLVVVSDDNQITYFDNESEYLEFEKSKPQLRATDSRIYMRVVVRLYKNYDSFLTPTTSMLIELTYNFPRISSSDTTKDVDLALYPDLRVYGHNDNISLAKVSLTIGNMTPSCNYRGQAALHMWEHINYGGENISNYASTAWTDGQYGPMKPGEEKSISTDFKVKAYRKYNGDGFNDIISSLKIVLTYTNMNEATTREPTSGGRTNTENENSTSSETSRPTNSRG